MTSSNGNKFRVTGLLCGEFTGHRWIPRTKASDSKRWCFLWSAPEPTAEQTIETPVTWCAIVLIMTSLQWATTEAAWPMLSWLLPVLSYATYSMLPATKRFPLTLQFWVVIDMMFGIVKANQFLVPTVPGRQSIFDVITPKLDNKKPEFWSCLRCKSDFLYINNIEEHFTWMKCIYLIMEYQMQQRLKNNHIHIFHVFLHSQEKSCGLIIMC